MATAEKDPLQSALDEAEKLMEEIDVTNVPSIDGFAIDSDDEDEVEDVPLSDPLNANGGPPVVHPLHADFLATPATTDSSTVAPSPTSANSMGVPGANNNNLTPGSSISGFSGLLPSPNHNMDALKTKTSQFASSFVNMAQRAATQVAAAVPSSEGMSMSPMDNMRPAPTPMMTSPQNPVVPQVTHVELDNDQKELLVQTHVGDLLPGEKVIMFLSHLMHVNHSSGLTYSQQTEPSTMWCCFMTYYRIVLFGTHPQVPPSRPHGWCASAWPATAHKPSILQMPLSSMDKVEKSVFSAGNTSLMGLALHGKQTDVIRFTTPSFPDTQRAYDALQTYAFPGRRNLGYLFAFESKREAVMASVITDETTGAQSVTLPATPQRFTPSEFERQFQRGSVPWTIYRATNNQYQICDSYPNILVGPASLNETHPDGQRILRGCAAFRSGQRLPGLTWSSGVDGASLWRAAQPKVGLQGNRSSADEMFFKHILESARSANAVSAHMGPSLSRATVQTLWGRVDAPTMDPVVGLKILDLRPRSAAMANRTGGYGYENVSYYPGTTLQFCNIGNIHAVRDAHQKLQALCLNANVNDIQWHASLEDTKWLSMIRVILTASWEAAYWVHVHRLPVLLHCSHGWDRTSQVSALSQLLLDPYYRTRKGFACLIEKDFMSFGHPFHTRCAHGEGRNDDKSGVDEGQISPIFLQFLDCTFQLVSQYPECFEFNTKYVLLLSEHLYSCRFGNFLCDTERERELLAGIRQRTHCVWDYLDNRLDTVNPRYNSETSDGVLLMPLPTLLRNVKLWSDRHCMHGPKPTSRYLPLGKEFPKDLDANHQSGAMSTQEELGQILLDIDLCAGRESLPGEDTSEEKSSTSY